MVIVGSVGGGSVGCWCDGDGGSAVSSAVALMVVVLVVLLPGVRSPPSRTLAHDDLVFNDPCP